MLVSNSLVRWIVFVANIVAFILALAMWLAPAKLVGKTDGILVFFAILFIVDAICVAPALPAA